MNRACFCQNTTELASSTQLNLHEQIQHSGCIPPMKNNFVRMKTHYFLAFILALGLTTDLLFGQDYIDNFILKDSEVVWQKVYPTTLTFNRIVKSLKEAGILQSLEVYDNKIIGEVKQFQCLYEELGNSNLFASYYTTNNLIAFFVFEYQDGKYRVTIKKMKMIKKTDENENPNYLKSIEDEVLKNKRTQFRDVFYNDFAVVLNYTLTKMFEFKEIKEDKW
jgi:hypothetical protein